MSITTEKRPALHLPALPKKPANAVPRSQKERVWLVGGGTVALLLTAIAYFFFISPQRSETGDVQGQVDSARSHNAMLEGKLRDLQQQNKELAKYQAQRAAAERALPRTSDVSDFLRSLQSLGAATQTDVVSLTVGQPTDVSAALTPGAASGVGAAAQPSASAAPAQAGNATSPPLAGVAPSAGASLKRVPTGIVYSLTITAQIAGSPTGLGQFLDQLQNVQPRAVLITSIVEAGSDSRAAGAVRGSTTLQLTMQAFVAPGNNGSAAPVGVNK